MICEMAAVQEISVKDDGNYASKMRAEPIEVIPYL